MTATEQSHTPGAEAKKAMDEFAALYGLPTHKEWNKTISRLQAYEAALREIAGEANALTWAQKTRETGNRILSVARKALGNGK